MSKYVRPKLGQGNSLYIERKQYKIPGWNCALVNFGTSRYHEEINLTKLPTPKDEFQGKC